ncbi:MAG: hypothetical protein AB8B77_07205 [Alphaproteobacteria bacterium]
MGKLKQIIASLCIMAGLQACTGAEPGVLLAASSLAIIITEDKLPTDLIGDAATGEDCNAIRRLEDKGPLCRPHITPEIIDRPIYCYRTLGAVECFSKRDPYDSSAQIIE